MKEYLKMESWGDIETTVNKLLYYRNKGVLVYTDFNETRLYSDTVTMDNAYLMVTGKTKAEFDKAQQDWHDNYEKELQEHKDKIPQLTIEWIEKGHEIIAKDKWDYWDEVVPTRLDDLYRGWELGCCLDIVKILNNGESLKEVKQEMEKQGHSGMSWGLVRLMVKEFCERGEEFAEYVKY